MTSLAALEHQESILHGLSLTGEGVGRAGRRALMGMNAARGWASLRFGRVCVCVHSMVHCHINQSLTARLGMLMPNVLFFLADLSMDP